jgi:hypothetical protein
MYYRLPVLIGAIAVVIVMTWLAAWQYVQQSLIRIARGSAQLGGGRNRLEIRSDDV